MIILKGLTVHKILNMIILLALLLSLISCEDDAVSQFRDNIIKVQLLDSATNSPMVNQEISIYYALEKVSSTLGNYKFGVRSNPIFQNMTMFYNIKNSSKIRITINDAKNFGIIKELYNSASLESGSHAVTKNSNVFTSGFYMLQFYLNGSHSNNMKILIANNSYVVLDGDGWNKVGNPYFSLVTDNNGIINVNMNVFKDIGTQIQRIYDSGSDMGIDEVINGFHCITSIPTTTGSKQYRKTVRIAQCKDKEFTWKISI